MTGLIHPESLERWNEWQRSRHLARRAKQAVSARARAVKSTVRPGPGGAGDSGPAWTLHRRDGAEQGRVLVAVDSASPTTRASLLSSLPYLRGSVDVLAPSGLALPELTGPDWQRQELPDPIDPARLSSADTRAVMSLGHFLAAGAAAHLVARRRDVPEFVVQHGALTPYAPPLPRDATVLCWSEADGAFWRSGRADVRTLEVGSQLLWQAAHEEQVVPQDDDDRRVVFLGQLHGAELPRRVTGGAAVAFCRAHGALYRPHPSEVDAVSRAQHRIWRRRGIDFAATEVSLQALPNPVVAVFSTGVLEAAVRGRDAWVYCPNAPAWVREFWDRYGMRQFGGQPTTAPDTPEEEPAARIARIVEELL